MTNERSGQLNYLNNCTAIAGSLLFLSSVTSPPIRVRTVVNLRHSSMLFANLSKLPQPFPTSLQVLQRLFNLPRTSLATICSPLFSAKHYVGVVRPDVKQQYQIVNLSEQAWAILFRETLSY
jgi:hypothetical protein